MIVKKCLKCGAIVKIIKDCTCSNCGITCCDKPMKEMNANTSDGAVEKHKPTYLVDDSKLMVTVNHVMEDDHYIEWIMLVTDDREDCRYLEPGKKASVIFDKVSSGKLYSYCNKHGLWMEEIK
jgi:superoxide reductase